MNTIPEEQNQVNLNQMYDQELSKEDLEAEEIAKNIRETVYSIIKGNALKYFDIIEQNVEPFIDHYLDVLQDNLENIYDGLRRLPIPDNKSEYKNGDLIYKPNFEYELPVDKNVYYNVWTNPVLRKFASDKISTEANFFTDQALGLSMRVTEVVDPDTGDKYEDYRMIATLDSRNLKLKAAEVEKIRQLEELKRQKETKEAKKAKEPKK